VIILLKYTEKTVPTINPESKNSIISVQECTSIGKHFNNCGNIVPAGSNLPAIMHFNRNITVFFLIVFIAAGTFLVQQCKPADTSDSAEKSANAFVGDQQCKTCHGEAFKAWSASGHYKAMLPASDSTVSGDFNNQKLVAAGMSSRFFKKDGKFFINTEAEDGSNQDFEIKYTFGYYPLQQYLVEFPGGRMQATRASWDVKNKKWFYQFPDQHIPAHSWFHWTGNAQNWNTMCANCHSTNLRKNYNSDSDIYHTSYSSINVSCETCHGAGKRHIDYIEGEAYKNGRKTAGSFLLLGKNGGQVAEIDACGVCHARRAEISAHPIPGAPFLDNYIPEIPTTEHYYADGQARDEDYNYTSFEESKMFRHGVTCSNCHEPHAAKLKFTGNELCTQCHGAASFDTEAHSFHPVGSEGSQCKNCHMPGKMYMGNDFRYDHTFRVPRPDLSVKYGTPNACNNCHQNKTAQWASDAVNKWYGPQRKYHFAEDLIPGSRLDEHSEAHLIRLLKDSSVPDIIKAASASYLGNIQTGNSLDALLGCLNLNDAQIRYRAVRSLAGFPVDRWMYPVAALLQDSSRAVRIAAADLFLTVPAGQIPPEYSNAYLKAKSELESYTLYQADFSVGSVMIGDYFLKQNNPASAIKFYRRGLKKDSLMNYARLNLSVAYNLSKQNDEAVQVLKDALKIDPKNDRSWFNLALLYNEMGNKAEAGKSLARAIELKTLNPRVYYNYGLLLQETGKNDQAADIYKKGIALAPTDLSLNYALAVLYLQTRQTQAAKAPAAVLKKYDPQNRDYQKIFQYLKLN
jgi:predicted CXXCH cytochrome family protein